MPPFFLVEGNPAQVYGLNSVGLKRAQFSPETVAELRQCYKIMYRSGRNVSQALAEMKEFVQTDEGHRLVAFVEAPSERGILKLRVAPAAALAAAALWCAQPARAGQPAQVDMQRILDMAELEAGFDTIRAEYYRAPSAQRLIDGARVGMASYLRGRGIADPALPYGHANGSYAHDLHELDKVYLAALVHYGDRIDAHALIQDALAGELAALGDPYSQFFTPPSITRSRRSSKAGSPAASASSSCCATGRRSLTASSRAARPSARACNRATRSRPSTACR